MFEKFHKFMKSGRIHKLWNKLEKSNVRKKQQHRHRSAQRNAQSG